MARTARAAPATRLSAGPHPADAVSGVRSEAPVTRTEDSRARTADRRVHAVLGAALLALLLAAPATATADLAVHAALVPDLQSVDPGDTVYVELRVTEPGLAFNGYDVVFGFDPGALAFLPASPISQQEGSYMKRACGNTFHYFVPAPDSLTLSHVILCAGVSLTGPGQLYKLRFRASSVPQATSIAIRHIQFYDAGVWVNPASYAPLAYVAIGVPTDVPPAGPAPGGPRLRAAPNPCRGSTRLVLEGRGAAGPLALYDLGGRRVRVLSGVEAGGADARRFDWDGRDAAGSPLPPGVYLAVVHHPAGVVGARVVLLP